MNLGSLRELSDFRMLRSNINGMGSKVVNFEHHRCHAASTFFPSPFDRALIPTMDEQGDGTSSMIAVGENARIRVLRKIPFPHSLAWVYTQSLSCSDSFPATMSTRHNG
jgi:carbamoyltransferase